MTRWFRVTFEARSRWIRPMIERIANGLVDWVGRQDRWEVLSYLGAVAFIIGVSLLAVTALRAPSTIYFCHVTTGSEQAKDKRTWTLSGVREWHPDVTIGHFDSFDETVAAAERIHCPLR